MPKNSSRYYWWCQISGWGLVVLMFTLLQFFYEKPVTGLFIVQQALIVFPGIGATHLFRQFVRRSNWLLLPIEKAFPKFLLGVIVVCIAAGLVRIGIIDAFHLGTNIMKFDFSTQLFFASMEYLFFLVPWILIYYFYHYIEKSRKQQLDTLKLESLVKELELKTIKSHINPHFIFNSLNSIRAMVDENPQRARTAITELSNILRSSMQVEKMETVPLQKELDIVKDYLALEHMRFEERLKIEMEIDEDTLEQPVPPMMLQTLVENAIKHGISKKIKGGVVKIISRYTDHHFELIVQNSGTIDDKLLPEGFGLTSTRDRLKFLFQGKAEFQIKKINGSEVQAKIVMPISY